jgi:hypothetical protein
LSSAVLSVRLREDKGLKRFEISVLMTILGPERDETTEVWESYVMGSFIINSFHIGFYSRQGLEIFLFITVSRPALGNTRPHI